MSSGRSPRGRRPGALRALSVALALGFALSELAGFAHLALERHEACPEHGELMHVTPEPGANQAAAPLVKAGDTRAGDARHHHCSLVPTSRPHGDATRLVAAIAVVALDPPALAPPSLTAPAAAVAVFVIAPKNSPPVQPVV